MSPQRDDDAEPAQAEAEPAAGSSRAWKLAAVVAVVAAFTALGVLGALLFGGSGSTDRDADVRACISRAHWQTAARMAELARITSGRLAALIDGSTPIDDVGHSITIFRRP